MAALLAFDTASERIAVAAGRDGDWRFEEGEGGARASQTLLPTILRVLEAARLGWADLDAIGFGRGPGAFTGIRTACSVAQGLAFGLGKPVLALDSLLAVAEDARARRDRFRVWVTIDARMTEIYAAEYEYERDLSDDDGGRWRVSVPPMLTDAARLAARWSAEPPQAVAGDAWLSFGEQLGAAAGTALRMAQARASAAALSVLAEQAWRNGEGVDPALALPVYLRDKVAQTTVERDAARAATIARAAP